MNKSCFVYASDRCNQRGWVWSRATINSITVGTRNICAIPGDCVLRLTRNRLDSGWHLRLRGVGDGHKTITNVSALGVHDVVRIRSRETRTSTAGISCAVGVTTPVTSTTGTRCACRRCTDAKSSKYLSDARRLRACRSLRSSGYLTVTCRATNQSTTGRAPVPTRAPTTSTGNNHTIGERSSA